MSLDTVLERLAANIFAHPYASDGKVNDIFQPARKVAKSVALTKACLQLNGPKREAYLRFDIDRRFAGIAWDDANLPPPNLIITNPENLHAHLVYELAVPVWLNGNPKIVRYLKSVERAMQRALDADPSYNGLLTKNPFHPSWRVTSAHSTPYTLGELATHLELDNGYVPREAAVRPNAGRDTTLFDSARYWAYSERYRYDRLEDFHDDILDQLQHINSTFEKGPKPRGVLRSIAKSVSNWVWNNKDICKRRGIMHLDPSESISVRQQMGQKFTAGLRTDRVIERIRIAVATLLRSGSRVTKGHVAEVAKVHRNTVYKYWDRVSDLLNDSDIENSGCVDNQNFFSVPLDNTVSELSVTSTLRSEETECLRHQYSEAPCGGQPERISDTPSCVSPSPSDPATEAEVTKIRHMIHAYRQARHGILINDAPESIKSRLQAKIEEHKHQFQRRQMT